MSTHSSMDMSDMSDSTSSSGTTSMSNMLTTFHTSIHTSLYTTAFTPDNTGQYVGAVFFLIIMGIIYRSLIALKAQMEYKWHEDQRSRKIVIGGVQTVQAGQEKNAAVTDTVNETRTSSSDASSSSDPIVAKDESKEVRRKRVVAPWRWRVDVMRGFLQLIIALVGYLLVLAGIFLGEIVFGRYIHSATA